jgi:LysM repeat protein
MRRTTICPSRVVHLAAIGLAWCLVAAPLAAQEPQPAAAQAPTVAPPATHIVQQGETLWALAQQFLGDPLLWPEIYRLNTMVIEDPHWIFPGEELRLAPGGGQAAAGQPAAQAGAAEVAAAPAAPGGITVTPSAEEPAAAAQQPAAGAAPSVQGPTIFSERQRRAAQAAASLQIRSRQVYRSVRMGEHFSAGFIADEYTLNRGRVLGNLQTSSLGALSTSSGAMLYSEMAIEPPPGDSLQVGDLLMSYDVPQYVQGYGSVIRPTGLLRVTSAGEPGETVTAQVVALYQPVQSGQGVLKAEPFQSPPGARPQPVDSGVVGRVIGLRGEHEVAVLQDVVFINLGSDDQVHPGDIFQLSDVSSASGVGAVEQDEGKVLIVATQPHTSSGVIIQLNRPDVRVGATARQIMRMKS